MISSKLLTSIIVWLLLALPAVHSQTLNIHPIFPKWDFGLRGGAGFSFIPLDRRQSSIFISSGSLGEGLIFRYGELYLGSYVTRYFGRHWSVRSELSVISKTLGTISASLGVFPRYRLTKFLNLETGMEARLPFNGWERARSRFSVGAAFGIKQLEFNLRISPDYQPPTPYNRGGWSASCHAGVSTKLANIGNLFGKKKAIK